MAPLRISAYWFLSFKPLALLVSVPLPAKKERQTHAPFANSDKQA
jgi:hypothetical protein